MRERNDKQTFPDRETDLFHVHTWRCRHAGGWGDEEYVKEALALGYTGIWFSDHAPFPGDPFKNRMSYEELPEYLASLVELRGRYEDRIAVHVGLEIEFLPSFEREGYYQKLNETPEIEFLLLGQHFAKVGDVYSFNLPNEVRERTECGFLGEAILSGLASGWFSMLAHPDRIFRFRKEWDPGMTKLSGEIAAAAAAAGTAFELNVHSLAVQNQFRPEFWQQVPIDAPMVYGFDVHSPTHIARRRERLSRISENWLCRLHEGRPLFESKEAER